MTSVIAYSTDASGAGRYAWRNQWMFNSKVSFTPGP